MDRTVLFQRIESAVIFIACIVLYSELSFSWAQFLVFILVPDSSMIGYLKSNALGAFLYNIGHSYFSPIILWFISYQFQLEMLLVLSLIWTTHIALDRMLGFGLKKPGCFKQTHLGNL